MDWDRFQQLAHLTRFSDKFETTKLDPHLFFYDFCKLTDLRKLTERFYIKKVNGSDLTWT
jgi:hypothetical protein